MRQPPTELDFPTPTKRAVVLATCGGLMASIIWGSWIVATRYAVTTELDAASIGFLRFLVPAIIFIPYWAPIGLIPKGVPIWQFLLVVAGGGFAVHLLAAYGLKFAPAAHFGALAPGTIPLFVAFFMFVIEGEKFSRLRLIGLAIILLGILGLGGWSAITSFSGEWRGHLLFLATAIIWASYTIYFRRMGINPFAMAGLIGIWSTIALIPFALYSGIATIGRAPMSDVLLQTLVQGFLSSVVAFVAYGFAVNILGAAKAALFTSLVPALATILAIPILGEWPGWVGAGAVALITVGVLFASGAVRLDGIKRRRTGRRPAAPL